MLDPALLSLSSPSPQVLQSNSKPARQPDTRTTGATAQHPYVNERDREMCRDLTAGGGSRGHNEIEHKKVECEGQRVSERES